MTNQDVTVHVDDQAPVAVEVRSEEVAAVVVEVAGTQGRPGDRGETGKAGRDGEDASGAVDPGDLTLIFENKLV